MILIACSNPEFPGKWLATFKAGAYIFKQHWSSNEADACLGFLSLYKIDWRRYSVKYIVGE